jgi:hypothetical protein
LISFAGDRGEYTDSMEEASSKNVEDRLYRGRPPIVFVISNTLMMRVVGGGPRGGGSIVIARGVSMIARGLLKRAIGVLSVVGRSPQFGWR